jgi:hypothetical protein
MTSADIFYGIGDGLYWLFQNTLEPTGELFWKTMLILGFLGFGYWMYRQVKYNKIAKNDPNQIK